MSDYIVTKDGEFMHYGVPGMKWGHRKAQPMSTGLTARQAHNAVAKARAKKFETKFDRDSARKEYDKEFSRKGRAAETVAAAKKSHKADLAYSKAKHDFKIAKQMEKQTAKELKTKYRKEYTSGMNAVQKAMSKVLGTDRNYAELRYDSEKNGYKD